MLRGLLLLFFLLFTSYQIPQDYPFKKDGTPTKYGIELYIQKNQDKIISEFQKFVQDTLYDVYISTDNLSTYLEGEDALGLCLSSPNSSEIIITNEEKYIGYEIGLLPNKIRRNIISANCLVKGTLIHELGHLYFNQVVREISMDTLYRISPEYTSRFLIIPKKSFGAKFIEEGVCEYILLHMKEEIVIEGQYFLMQSTEYIMAKENKYQVFYQYAPQYLDIFIDNYGLKRAIQILVTNSPPGFEEILEPGKFFSRLVID